MTPGRMRSVFNGYLNAACDPTKQSLFLQFDKIPAERRLSSQRDLMALQLLHKLNTANVTDDRRTSLQIKMPFDSGVEILGLVDVVADIRQVSITITDDDIHDLVCCGVRVGMSSFLLALSTSSDQNETVAAFRHKLTLYAKLFRELPLDAYGALKHQSLMTRVAHDCCVAAALELLATITGNLGNQVLSASDGMLTVSAPLSVLAANASEHDIYTLALYGAAVVNQVLVITV